jgi:hypothetical protein
MRFSQWMLIAAASTMAMALSPGAGMAHLINGSAEAFPDARGYTGSWPVTVSHSQHSNGTYCLTLTEYGSNGGSATLVIGTQKFPYGTFQIFDRTLVATIQSQGYGQNAGLVFIGSASRGSIGKGVFDDVYGGEAFDEGALAFGTKGGC